MRLQSLLSVDCADPRERRRGRTALAVLYGCILFGIPVVVGLYFIPTGQVLAALVLGSMCLCLVGILFVRRGRIDLGIGIFFAAIVSAASVFAVATGDSRLTAVYLVLPVVIAGALQPPRRVSALAVVTLACGVAVTVMYPPDDPPPTAFEIALAAAVFTGLVIITSTLGFRGVRLESQRADQVAEELRALNLDLEQRVEARTHELQQALDLQDILVAELAELSVRDPLTGLHNRRHADHELPRLAAVAERFGQPLALAMADLDHFKQVNDGTSYSVGDEVLRRFAALLSEFSRTTDVITRYGGEEFLLAMPQTSADQAAIVCDRLRRAVEEYPWGDVHPGLAVTVSIGVSDSIHSGGLVTLAADADAALHRAKQSGRNRVVLARPHGDDIDIVVVP